MLSLKLLGSYTASLDSRPLATFRSDSGRALLIYLVAEKDRGPLSREALSEMFWPGIPPTSSRKNLRQTLYELRQVIAEAHKKTPSTSGEDPLPLILSDRRTIQLNPEADVESDLDSLEILIRQDSPDSLAAAVELYTGDFLGDFYLPGSAEFEAWAAAKKAYYRELVMGAMASLSQVALDRGDFEAAASYAQRQLDLDDLHEPAHRQRMMALALAGRRPEALSHYDRLRQTLRDELGVEPSERTVSLARAIVDEEVSLSGYALSGDQKTATRDQVDQRPASNNLPAQVTGFVGRKEELSQVRKLLVDEPDHHLLTLLGPGGSGKTRLAIEAAWNIAQEDGASFPDGVWFVPLDNLSGPESIVPTVAHALNFNLHGPDEPRRQLLDYLAGKKLLLILDNYEHLLQDGLTPLAAEITSAASQVKVLTTSRTRLNTRGEQLLRVSGLAFPYPSNQLSLVEAADFDALRLFQQSARRVEPSFLISADNLSPILEICHLVQGMPLGIELAASWITLLAPPDIVREINRSLDFLETQWQDLPKRQRSLRAVFEGSWRMLTGRERDMVSALSLFQSSFSREAAQAVSGASPAALASLVGKSWLAKDISGRFQIHSMLRQYGREMLQKDETNRDDVIARHANYHLTWLERLNRDMRGPSQKEAFDALGHAFEDIRAAWNVEINQGRWDSLNDEILAALLYFASSRDGMAGDVLTMIREARNRLDGSGGDPVLDAMLQAADALLAYGYFYIKFLVGWWGYEDLSPIGSSWTVLSKLEPGRIDALWLVLSALAYGWQVDTAEAIEYLRTLIDAYRQRSERWSLAFALEHLGRLISQSWFPANIKFLVPEERRLWEITDTSGQERSQEVLLLLEEAAAIWEEIGDTLQHADTLRLLAFNIQRHDPARSVEAFNEARALYDQLGDRHLVATMLNDMAHTSLYGGHIEQAFENFREARLLYEDLGNRRIIRDKLSAESIQSLRYGDVDHARHLRRRNLALAQELGDEHPLAWALWEMGDIERVSGDHAAARRLYERSRAIFSKIGEPTGRCFYLKGLGDIALTEDAPEKARRYFQEALQLAEEIAHDWAAVYCGCGLSRAEMAIGRLDDARLHLSNALRDARLIGFRDLLPYVFSCSARWHTLSGRPEVAIILGEFAANMNTIWHETRRYAQDVLKEASELLPADTVQSALQKSQELDVPSAVLLALSPDASPTSPPASP